jgi:hypothetical protein
MDGQVGGCAQNDHSRVRIALTVSVIAADCRNAACRLGASLMMRRGRLADGTELQVRASGSCS